MILRTLAEPFRVPLVACSSSSLLAFAVTLGAARSPSPTTTPCRRRRRYPPPAPARRAAVASPAASADVGVPAPTHPSLGKGFESPEAAAKALFDAFEANDDVALRAIMGPGNDDLVQDGKDPIVHCAARRAGRGREGRRLTLEKQADGQVVLVVGTMDYPLAIPLVAKDGVWRADAAAGRHELLARRIGEHEFEAIGVCLAYADAQVEYASKDRNDDGVKEYAQRLVSTPGTKDGLSWESAPDEEASPAGPELTPFREALTPDATPIAPFNGYYWRILTAQGAHAPGGAYSYVINGRMIAGFALLAVPAVHRNTGVMSFLVSNQGKVYEKDLGPDTLKVAAGIEAFDPDPSWRVVDEATLRAAAATSPEDAAFVEKSPSAPSRRAPWRPPGRPRPPRSAASGRPRSRPERAGAHPVPDDQVGTSSPDRARRDCGPAARFHSRGRGTVGEVA